MALFKIYRETTLPGTLEPYSVYMVAPAAKPDYVEIYVSNAAGTAAKRVLTDVDIQGMITASITGANNLQVVADITARNALSPTTTIYVYVKDATGDASVDSGGATYLYDTSTSTWVKVSESESLDLSLSWSALDGKPASTPANIDDAVSKRHAHTNKTELDKVGEDGSGNFTYNGSPVSTQWASTGW